MVFTHSHLLQLTGAVCQALGHTGDKAVMELILQDLVTHGMYVFTSSDAVMKHSDQASSGPRVQPITVKEVKAAGVDAAGLITCTSGDRVRFEHPDA